MIHKFLTCGILLLLAGCGSSHAATSALTDSQRVAFAADLSRLTVTSEAGTAAEQEQVALLTSIRDEVAKLNETNESDREEVIQSPAEETPAELPAANESQEPSTDRAVSQPAGAPSEHVVFFTAPWCGVCKATLPQMKADLESRGITVTEINVDETPRPDVSRLPTIDICDWESGDVRKRWVGKTSTETILAAFFGTDSAAMSHDDMVALHNKLHGGGSWTWPGDLETHLRETHGVDTGVSRPVAARTESGSRLVSRGASCPTGNCPAQRRGLFGRLRR